MARLVVFSHFDVRVAHQPLDVFLRETLLFVQPRAQRPSLLKRGALTGWHVVLCVRCITVD